MKIRSTISLIAMLCGSTLQGQISIGSLNTPYTQDFEGLSNSGTSSTLPPGWSFVESDTNADGLYAAGTGSSSAGDTYSFGEDESTDRSLGELTSGSLQSTFGVWFENNTGNSLSSLEIGYTGEQWRSGNTDSDRLDFQYSLDATSLADGAWTDWDALDFNAPNNPGGSGALDGNSGVNQNVLNAALSGFNLANGATVWLRWSAFDASGTDHGLAVDDFSLTAVPEPHETACLSGLALLALAFRRRWRSRGGCLT